MTFFRVVENAVSHSQRCEIHLSDRDVGIFEACIDVIVEILAPKNVQEDTFQMVALYADWVSLELVIYFIFLCCCI